MMCGRGRAHAAHGINKYCICKIERAACNDGGMICMSEDLLMDLERQGVIMRNDHFVYSSGLHGDAYVNKRLLTTVMTSKIAEIIFQEFMKEEIDIVVAPAHGAISLGSALASKLFQSRTYWFWHLAIANKSDQGFAFDFYDQKRLTGNKILVIEDVLTTGASILKVVELVRAHGGDVAGVAAFCNRGGVTADKIGDVPKLFSVINFSFQTWSADACPLCSQGITIRTDVGHGADFILKGDKS